MSNYDYLKARFKEEYDTCKAKIPAGMFTRCNQLRALLLNDSNRGRLRNQESGRIDRGRLASLVAGDTRVFQRRHPKQDTNTFVQVAVDASGSMYPDETLSALILLNKVFAGTEIKHEMVAWAGGNNFLLTEMFSEHDHVSNAWKLGSYWWLRGGGTPTTGAIFKCGNRLMSRKDTRKIMIVVSDGNPNFDHEGGEVKRLCNEVLPANGIEVMGVSIGDKCNLDKLIDDCAHAENFSDFPQVLIDTARKALL